MQIGSWEFCAEMLPGVPGTQRSHGIQGHGALSASILVSCTLHIMLVLGCSNFPGGCSLHSVKAWPSALILHVIHCPPCLLVTLVIVTITFSKKFPNST